ncbi:NAD-dependent epimerase/dehydratase family protein [Labrys monachus]|uniref:Uronate dehydrogenase n=1 Tax=Labrys monachus TaxID=217067 RepID=A0ABU0FA56_9HYPH|nr:NAD(P)-dependent oxidoreductase [Labrys monachus]MDQ0391494.1 uronate dehydrogenase [Labrys monachus]
MSRPLKPVLLTGASGTLGRLLAHRLAALGWTLRLTDIRDFPDPLPPGAAFERADLEEGGAVGALARGCGLILHFGGISTEHPFDTILGPNLRGSFNIYEAARQEKARVVFASSNHVFGFYERTVKLDQDDPMRPDGFYGLSKAYGEMLARVYWEKHAVESVLIRIGSVLPEVPNERILSTWLSHDDFVALVERCAEADKVGCTVVWGASDNSRSFWNRDGRAVIGWRPRDSSDDQAEKVRGKVTDDPVTERYQGGVFVRADYSREDFPPAEMFPSPANLPPRDLES